MSTPTLKQVFHDAQRLPIADQQLLVELLKPRKTIEQLGEERGIGPFDFEAARAEAAVSGRKMRALMISLRLCANGAAKARRKESLTDARNGRGHGVELVTHNASDFDYLLGLTIIMEP